MKILLETIDSTGEFEKSPAFEDYKTLLAEVEKLLPDGDLSDYPDDFFRNVEMMIRYGAFKKLGKGSSRTAYSFDADPRYALKFAHNVNGVRQNRTEIKNAKAGDYACIVRVLKYDPAYILIVEDRCDQSSFDDWNRILGISSNMLSKLVRVTMDRREDDRRYNVKSLLADISDFSKASAVLKKDSAMDDELTAKDYPKIIECLENICDAAAGRTKEPKWVALYDLFRFYFDHGMGAMIPEEILFIDQWGVRPGKTPDEDALIIVDPGVDTDFRPFVGRDGKRVR